MSDIDFPEGLGHPHLEAPTPIRRHASPLSLLILGSLVAAALLGAFGGNGLDRLEADGAGARLAVETPATLRNGEFYEVRVAIVPKRPVTDLVFAVEPSLWRQTTQNSMLPAAAEESFSDGAFRFSYGPADAGEERRIKMDFQINPSLLGNVAGTVSVLDGDSELASLPVTIEVRP
ncbi:hypothetical protein [Aureimonas sp. SK2]|uniref:hypothetical protein n=1 Tax=Aureimonas sp. SK2 TaxID=3015992 RepID=UPI002443B49D|nr:hypothetical protein [Aureimonas sp. SK2]